MALVTEISTTTPATTQTTKNEEREGKTPLHARKITVNNRMFPGSTRTFGHAQAT